MSKIKDFSILCRGILAIIILTGLVLPFPQTSFASVHASSPMETSELDTGCLDLHSVQPGTSVEGLNTVMENLDIHSTGNAIVLAEGIAPRAYGAPNGNDSIINGNISSVGGFVDLEQLHEYSFTFTPGISIDYFSIQLLDFGDFNPDLALEHHVSLVAFDSSGQQIDIDTLSFTSDGQKIPRGGSAGDLWVTGDASTAQPGEPGNYSFSVSGSGITLVDLQFSSNLGIGATDPLFALSVLCFSKDNPSVPSNVDCVDFTQIPVGMSVEGLGTVNPDLNIGTSGSAVSLAHAIDPKAWGAPNGSDTIINNGLDPDVGGFSDVDQLHEYSFSFAPDVLVNYFSVQMLDFGDFNPDKATEHQIDLVAYDGNNQVIDQDNLFFTSDGQRIPRGGSAGDLWLTGDAITAKQGEPGNYTFAIAKEDIARLELRFSSNLGDGATDPLFGLTALCFAIEEPPLPPAEICVDFNILPPGSSVEGLGTINPYLNISSSGNVVALAESINPKAYGAPNGQNQLTNGGIDTLLAGFTDIEQQHDYAFSFAPDVTVDNFSVKMLDFGDFNPNEATEHQVSLVAYDKNNQIVDQDTLFFTSDGQKIPHGGSAGDLWLTGDAITALPGEPGNYTFDVAGSNIYQLELQFSSNLGVGATDPLFGFSVLCFEPENDIPPLPPDSPQSCDDFGLVTLGENNWNEHVIRNMTPVELEFDRPYGADFAVVNTAWRWSGYPNQYQVTEKHSVETPVGTAVSDDYGNEELEGETIWYDSFAGDFIEGLFSVTIDYAGDGSDPGSHYAYGQVLWCAEELPTLPPTTYETCEDHNMVSVGSDSWDKHIRYDIAPETLNFPVPQDASFGIVNTGWEWTGRPNQAQVTEKHTVATPFGTTTSDDYGNEELINTIFWYDQLSGSPSGTDFEVVLSYAGDGSDPGSHLSHGFIDWCSAP